MDGDGAVAASVVGVGCGQGLDETEGFAVASDGLERIVALEPGVPQVIETRSELGAVLTRRGIFSGEGPGKGETFVERLQGGGKVLNLIALDFAEGDQRSPQRLSRRFIPRGVVQQSALLIDGELDLPESGLSVGLGGENTGEFAARTGEGGSRGTIELRERFILGDGGLEGGNGIRVAVHMAVKLA